jgi:DEAD/DEAH box helicase domain-containing protein
MPLLVLCDRNDIGGISHPFHEQFEKPAVFIYDGYSGGIGLTRKAFSLINQLMRKTLAAVRDCTCDLGCPSCVHSPKCGSGNRPIDKHACVNLLAGLLKPQSPRNKTLSPFTCRKNDSSQREVHPETSEKNFTLPEKYGVFDVETRRSAHEVGGWHRADRMGVSVAVLYDAGEDAFFSFQEHEIDGLIDHLFNLELVIGFNNKRFDNRVLSAYTSRRLNNLPTLDILEEISSQLGYRLSLERLAEHTLGTKKSGSGLLALKWFKEGRMDLIEKYCRKDVAITRDLFLYGIDQHHLLFQNKAGMVVRLPVSFQERVKRIIAG